MPMSSDRALAAADLGPRWPPCSCLPSPAWGAGGLLQSGQPASRFPPKGWVLLGKALFSPVDLGAPQGRGWSVPSDWGTQGRD